MKILKKILFAITIISSPGFGSDLPLDTQNQIEYPTVLELPEGLHYAWKQSGQELASMTDDELIQNLNGYQFTYLQAPAYFAFNRALPTKEKAAQRLLKIGQYQDLGEVGNRTLALDFILKYLDDESPTLQTIKQKAKEELLSLANFTKFPKAGTSRVGQPLVAATMYYNHAANDQEREAAIEALRRYAKGLSLYNGPEGRAINKQYTVRTRTSITKFFADHGHMDLAKENLTDLAIEYLTIPNTPAYTPYYSGLFRKDLPNQYARAREDIREILLNIISDHPQNIDSRAYTYENLIKAATTFKDLFPNDQVLADQLIENLQKSALEFPEFESFVSSPNRPLTLKDLNTRIGQAHKVYRTRNHKSEKVEVTSDLFTHKANENKARNFIARGLLNIGQYAPLTKNLIDDAYQTALQKTQGKKDQKRKSQKYQDAKVFLNSTLQQN